MRTFLNIIIAISAAITAFSLGFLIHYKLSFKPSAHFTGKKLEHKPKNSPKLIEEISSNNSSDENIPADILSQVENISSVVTSYIIKIKNGPATFPALILKVTPAHEGLNVFLLTFYPMEWPFINAQLMGRQLTVPEKVYQCDDGLLILEYKVKGIFPVETERGMIEKFGAIVSWAGNDTTVKLFDIEKGCSENGFVFNLAGDFSGVCFGGNFYSAEELYNSVPSNCKIIFEKEGKSGNL
ncbi:hypothetical protein [Desulfurobacterium sp.]|uniref:hypothetical protein n=1 Tax=Desulfurobacterium sp. TaxID=2004706 RepID=UPI00260B8EB5|nr:hypothetical protein [Desulfurobacterium sp.]